MAKFYFSGEISTEKLTKHELEYVTKAIESRIMNSGGTESSGVLEVPGREPIFFKATSVDATGFYTVPA